MTTVDTLTAAVEAHDPYLQGHAARVTVYAEGLARRLGWSAAQLDALRLGCALHDVGKLVIPEPVLRRRGALSPEDVAELRRHPVEGVRLIAGSEQFRKALPYVLFHHERWDGEGYPTGRRGEQIPIEGRVLALADAFDAMISSRSHRPAMPIEYALGEIERCAGTQFDPDLARLFLATWTSAVVEQPLAASVG